MKYTPGPWKSRINKHRVSVTSEGGTIATLMVTAKGSKTTKQRMANARLIASAPDLLEVCQYILNQIEHTAYPSHKSWRDIENTKRLKNVILNAMGEMR